MSQGQSVAGVLRKVTAERLQSVFSQVSVRDFNMAVLSKTRSDGDFASFQVRTVSVSFHNVQIHMISYLAVT